MTKEVKHVLALNFMIYILTITLIGITILRLPNPLINSMTIFGFMGLGYLILFAFFRRKPSVNPVFKVVKQEMVFYDYMRLIGLMLIALAFYYQANRWFFITGAATVFVLHNILLIRVNQKIKTVYSNPAKVAIDYVFANKTSDDLYTYANRLRRNRLIVLLIGASAIGVFVFTNFVHPPVQPFYLRIIRAVTGYIMFFIYSDIVYKHAKFHISVKRITFLYHFAFLTLFIAVIVFNLTGLYLVAAIIGLLAILPIQKLYHDVPRHVEIIAQRLENHHGVI